MKGKQLTAVITFVDFKKAFDSIHRRKLMEILQAYGIPHKIGTGNITRWGHGILPDTRPCITMRILSGFVLYRKV